MYLLAQPEPLSGHDPEGERFELYVPLEKGIQRESDGHLYLDGPISTEALDLQGERTLYKAVEEGLETFLRLQGPVDYDHQSVQRVTPEQFDQDGAPVRFIIGYKAEGGLRKGVHNGRPTFFLKTRLMQGKKAVADLAEHVRTGGKLFYSIGGVVLEKAGDLIRRCRITHVAVTPYPANPECQCTGIGFGALAKSLGKVAECRGSDGCSPIDDLPRRSAGRPSFVAEARPEQIFRTLFKTMTAGGQLAGFGSTGGRAVVAEDIEGGETRHGKRCQCAACRRKRRQRGDDDAVHDTTLFDRSETMEKTLDPQLAGDLTALEADEKVGPLAKAMNFLLSGFAALTKGRKKDDDGEDGDSNYDDDDGKDGDDNRDGEADDDDQMGKGFRFNEPDPFGQPYGGYAGADPSVAGVDAQAFGEALVKSLCAGFAQELKKSERRQRKELLAEVDKRLAEHRTELEKSLGARFEASETLMKSIGGDLEQLGALPRGTSRYRPVTPGTPPGAAPNVPTKVFVLDLLEKAVMARQISPAVLTQTEINIQEMGMEGAVAQLPQPLQKALHSEFQKSIAA